MNQYVGNTYRLEGLTVTDSRGATLTVSGPYVVEDYEAEDRSAGILGSAFCLVPADTSAEDWESLAVYADPYDLLEQIDPERVAKERQQEAQFERELEQESEAEAEALWEGR